MQKIIHCDADCFFAAVEMRDDPSLRNRPIAVGGSTDKRGVISTCNYEARRFGIHSAMATNFAMRRCPELIVLPHRMDAYRDASLAMRRIFYEYTELVEPLSLDEAFLDVSESGHCRGSATLIAAEIRARVKKEVGITLSAGVAPNKFLAKIASDWRKPNGLFVIKPNEVAEFVTALEVQKIYGVGKATAARLAGMNVSTCADLQKLGVFELTRCFGQMGVRLFELSCGIDHRQINVGRRRKSLSVEHTFPYDLPNVDSCIRQLPELMQQLSLRLRQLEDDYRVVKLLLKMKFADFSCTTIERGANIVSLSELQELCMEAHARFMLPVRLLGVGVRFIDLREDKAFFQLDLFE